MSKSVKWIAVAGVLAVAMSNALADEDLEAKVNAAAEQVNQKYAEQKLDIKKLFSAKCSWCHQGYGMKQADGPKLGGTEKTHEQVVKQIANGKSPMPGFKNQLKDYELQALADYIKALPK